MRNMLLTALLCVWVLLAVEKGIAGPRPPWTGDMAALYLRSDLVLIVDPVSSRAATDQDAIVWPTTREYLAPIVTRCDVVAVMKGEFRDKTFELRHFRFDWDALHAEGFGIGNAPRLIEFQFGDQKIDVNESTTKIHPVYLLFLTKNKAGQFTPVTGQEDSYWSVMQIHRPFPSTKAEPSDAPKDQASRFDNGNSTSGPR